MKKQKKKPIFLPLLIILLLLAAAAAVVLILRRPDSPFPAASETPVSAAPQTGTILQAGEPKTEQPEPDTDAGCVIITELMVRNKAALRSADGDFPDWVELKNISDREISLEGWTLSDGSRKDGAVLPDRTLSLPERNRIRRNGRTGKKNISRYAQNVCWEEPYTNGKPN